MTDATTARTCTRCHQSRALADMASKGRGVANVRSYCKMCARVRPANVATAPDWQKRVQKVEMERAERRTPSLTVVERRPRERRPTGQAALWYDDAIQHVNRKGQAVALHIARLCGEDSEVTISIRSLADAVGRVDRAGRHVNFTQLGIKSLVDNGYLSVTKGRGPRPNTYHLV